MIDILNTSGRISIRTKSEVAKTAKEVVNVAQADKLLPLFEDIEASEQRAKDYAQALIDNLINGSPAALDTLYELSAALGDDPNFAASIMEQIGTRASKDVATQSANGLMSAADKAKLDTTPLSADVAVSEQRAKNHAQALIDNLINGSPTALNTLKKLATAIGNDPNFFTTIIGQINTRASKDVATQSANGLMSAADKAKLDTTPLSADVAVSEQRAKNHAQALIDNLINGSPTALNTLKKLATAIGNDPKFATTIMGQINSKASKNVATSSANGLMSAADKTKLDGTPLSADVVASEQRAKDHAQALIDDLINGAPTALNTLKKLATAIGNDPNFAGNIRNELYQLGVDIQYSMGDLASTDVATQSANGLMSAADKVKLDNTSHGVIWVLDSQVTIHTNWNSMAAPGTSVKYISQSLNMRLNEIVAQGGVSVNVVLLHRKGDTQLFMADSKNKFMIKPGINYFSFIRYNDFWCAIPVSQGTDIPAHFPV